MARDREATEQRLAKLEREVIAALAQYGNGEVNSVRLAQGAEEADVSSNVDFLVRSRGRTERVFTVVSLAAMTRFLGDEATVRTLGDFYTSGGPLIIVRKMSSDVIVRGIVKYLEMERAWEC